MKNVALMVLLLVGGFGVARAAGAETNLAGRIGVAAVFLLTAIGHFVKPDEMLHMIPPSLPARRTAVILSGFLELFFAFGIVVARFAHATGVAICVFLVLVTPLNVYSALNKVQFGGHAAGPRYLAVRLPLQLLLLIWTWWFAVRT